MTSRQAGWYETIRQTHPGARIEPVLPTDSAERKRIPLYSGCIAYFPLALAAVARVSQRGNDKHNPGQELHHARNKSADHKDCVARHLAYIDTYNVELQEFEDAACLAWRALAYLQELEEKRLGKGLPPGARVDPEPAQAPQPLPLTCATPGCGGTSGVFSPNQFCTTCVPY